MAQAKFYIYVHRRGDNHQVFYVGKGSKRRAWCAQGRSNFWENVKTKHGIVVEVVERFDSEDRAFKHEIALIAVHRAIGQRLCNVTSGGEGATGNVMSEEAKKKISSANLGRLKGPDSEETRRKKSESAKGRPMSAEAIAKTVAFHTGRKRSPETLLKMSQALKGKGLGVKKSEEARRKMSEARKGKPLSEKARAAISKGHEKRTKYCVMTDEHKAKILAGQAAYWARKRAEKAQKP